MNSRHASRLLAWYRRRRRDLPWRRRHDPYAIWLSEIMLQQTQVDTVIPFYRRFLRRFPTIRSLAGAKLDDVLKIWAGLGYYARARALHRAARDLAGRPFPRTIEGLRRIPGVGPYTAAAIGSIAFGIPEPVVDGNTRRVAARWLALASDPRSPAGARRIDAVLRSLIPARSPGDFNQAVMELGQTICTPRAPRCADCPVRPGCHAFARGLQNRIPRPRRARPVPHHEIGLGIVWKKGRLLIARRREEGLLGGLWEFPGGKRRLNETLPACVRREVREETGVETEVVGALGTVRHRYSHLAVTLRVFTCRWKSGRPRPIESTRVRWVRPADLARYAFPSANRRIISMIRKA